MQRDVGTGEAAEAPGVLVVTLRRRESSGKPAVERTPGGHRRYDLAKLRAERFRAVPEDERRTIACARVSSHDRKADLERRKQVLELYCARRGWTFGVVSDPGSGMNDCRKGLETLLDVIVDGSVGRLVITRRDRLVRFGADLVFADCEAKRVEVVIPNRGEDTPFEEDPARDVPEIATVFSARLHGSRSHRNRRLPEGVARAAQEAGPC